MGKKKSPDTLLFWKRYVDEFFDNKENLENRIPALVALIYYAFGAFTHIQKLFTIDEIPTEIISMYKDYEKRYLEIYERNKSTIINKVSEFLDYETKKFSHNLDLYISDLDDEYFDEINEFQHDIISPRETIEKTFEGLSYFKHDLEYDLEKYRAELIRLDEKLRYLLENAVFRYVYTYQKPEFHPEEYWWVHLTDSMYKKE